MIGQAERALSHFEARIVSGLTHLRNPLWPFVFSLLIPVLIFLSWPFWSKFDYLKIAHWDIVKNVEVMFIALVFLSPFATIVRKEKTAGFLVFASLFAWGIHCSFKEDVFTASPLTWLAAFAVPLLLAFTWWISFSVNLRLSAKGRVFWLLGLTMLLALFVGLISFHTGRTIYLDLFWGAHIEIFVLVAVARLLTKKNFNQADHKITRNPMNLITGVFWPFDLQDRDPSSRVASRELWWFGYYTLVTGFLFQLASMIMYADRAELFTASPFLGLQWMTICSFLGLTAMARITTGVARLYGVSVPDASNFVLFPRSPVDPLRRGYVYAYEFNLRYICLPLVRHFKSMWLAVFLTFSFYVFYRFLLQPVLVPMAYNLIFPNLGLYIPRREAIADIARSLVLLAAFFVEPLFVRVRVWVGPRYGDLCCVLLTYLVLSGMRMAESEITLRFLKDWL